MLHFHKEGAKIILVSCVIVVAIVIGAGEFIENLWIQKPIQLVALFFLIMILQFFRNPNRAIIANNSYITAPVDGKVVVIEEVFEPEYFKDKRLQVSIFMSPINVHVTRFAASGKINFSKYHPGKYLVAWHPKASTENERTTVVIDTPVFGEILYRQIAGALARRIVNYAKQGMQVVQGQDAGFIKFGSRVDIYLPIGTKLNVKLNEVAKGNKTIIAFKND
jgi:phosphatidylserine decarboxylase